MNSSTGIDITNNMWIYRDLSQVLRNGDLFPADCHLNRQI